MKVEVDWDALILEYKARLIHIHNVIQRLDEELKIAREISDNLTARLQLLEEQKRG